MKYVTESLEQDQHQSVKRVETDYDKGKTMERIRIKKHYQFIIRDKNGRFKRYRLECLLGILMVEVIIFLWMI